MNTSPINLQEEYAKTEIAKILNVLDEELVGLAPVKSRIREIAALLLIDKLRRNLGITSANPGLHMSFTGSPGTGKTTVGLKMADILFQLGYITKGHLLTVTRDDLVGQYIGHTAPKRKKSLRKQWAEFYLLTKLTIYINLIMKEIMGQKRLKFYYKLWKINVMS
jgi:SpoVK/Ycf46/Vps4 family AAA+-type ATPase